VVTCVDRDTLRLSSRDDLFQLGSRALAPIPDDLVVEFVLLDPFDFQTAHDCRLRSILADNCGRTPGQIAKPQILSKRILVSFPCKSDPDVYFLFSHGLLDPLQLLPKKLHPDREFVELHALPPPVKQTYCFLSRRSPDLADGVLEDLTRSSGRFFASNSHDLTLRFKLAGE